MANTFSIHLSEPLLCCSLPAYTSEAVGFVTFQCVSICNSIKIDGFRFSPLVLPHQELPRDLLSMHICSRLPYQEVPPALSDPFGHIAAFPVNYNEGFVKKSGGLWLYMPHMFI